MTTETFHKYYVDTLKNSIVMSLIYISILYKKKKCNHTWWFARPAKWSTMFLYVRPQGECLSCGGGWHGWCTWGQTMLSSSLSRDDIMYVCYKWLPGVHWGQGYQLKARLRHTRASACVALTIWKEMQSFGTFAEMMMLLGDDRLQEHMEARPSRYISYLMYKCSSLCLVQT